ncbi:MAG TPA: septum formation initiator family protein [Gemmatimonadaceae bacterium]|nr:septum formation initiator family protein [Gemmatimonadaceae bacterium]
MGPVIQRLIFALIVLGGLLFAVQGGEYSTMDLWRQRERRAQLIAQADSLRRQVDSLKKMAKAIASDRATQERIAREEFGMVRGDKEILYRFGDTADTATARRR